MKKATLIFLSFLTISQVFAQQSDKLSYLVDSLPIKTPVLLNLKVDSGFMAVERVALSNNGEELYYGVRNGYDPNSIAEIRKISWEKDHWSDPLLVFPDSCGAPALSRDGKTMFFQYDHPSSPKGLYSKKTDMGWSEPVPFSNTARESHYLQQTGGGSYYYSSTINEEKKIRDIFRVELGKSDTLIKSLGFDFNCSSCCTDFFISRDESYIILSMYKTGNENNYQFFGEIDLFITFKGPGNSWSKPVNLGKEINGLSAYTWGQFVTKDNLFLLFSSWSKPVGVYMIKFSDLLERLRKKLVL